MYILGLDIGTTSICGLVIDAQSGETVDCITVPNNTFLMQSPDDRRQDPHAILSICLNLVDTLCSRHAGIRSIGVTGQMHGILYDDQSGNTLSPLYTWQDTCGEQRNAQGVRYAEQLSSLTGYAMASGFGGSILTKILNGITTHYSWRHAHFFMAGIFLFLALLLTL